MIEKILERLEETRWTTNFDAQCVFENAKLDKCIEIVQEVAKEYDNTSDTDLTVVSALPSLYPLQPFEEEAIHKVVASARNGGWIPTKTELPLNGTYLYVTCHSYVDDRPDWVAQSFYFNDKWGIPLVDCGKAEVIAWMEEKLPAPYQKGE